MTHIAVTIDESEGADRLRIEKRCAWEAYTAHEHGGDTETLGIMALELTA